MHFPKITLAIVAAAVPAFACSGARDASARNSSPELQPVGAQQRGAGNSPTVAKTDTLPRAGATSDTIKAGAVTHPTPPVLDSLIKGTLAARGLYVFRYAATRAG